MVSFVLKPSLAWHSQGFGKRTLSPMCIQIAFLISGHLGAKNGLE